MKLLRYLIFTIPIILATILYGYTIRLPLFLDDGPQFRMVEVFTGFDQWLGSPAYFYYRPAVFSIWKLSSVLAGGFDALGLHWLNLMLFGMTGVLLAAIAYRLMPQFRHITALGVGVGWVIFPFNYQTVILVGAMFHTSMIFCTALTIWTALLWWKNPRPYWLIVAILSAFWGIFSHENGVLIAPITLLTIWTAYGYKAILSRRIITLILPIIIITIIYLVLYVTVPRAESVGGLQPIGNMVESFAIMIQSAAYPLSALLRPLITDTPPAWVTIVIGIVVLGGGLCLITIFAPIYNRIAVFGVMWYLMALMPTVILLDTAYVDGSPRILIYAGMGLHLFYGALFGAMWQSPPPTPSPQGGEGAKRQTWAWQKYDLYGRIRRSRISAQISQNMPVGTAYILSDNHEIYNDGRAEAGRAEARPYKHKELWIRWAMRLLIIFTCALMLIISIPFIHTRREHLLILNDYMRRLHDYIQNQPQNPQTTPILLVNAPDYITPKPENRTFLRGSEGVAMMFYLVDYDRQIWVNTGILPMIRTAKIDEINRAQGYDVYLHDPATSWDEARALALDSATIYVTQFHESTFYPVYVGTPNIIGDDTPDVIFDQTVTLTDSGAVYLPQKNALLVKLRWQVQNPAPIKPFVHVVCDDALVAQLDGHVWADIYPFEFWREGEIQTEYRHIPLPMPFDDARCDIFAGVYHQQTLERLSALDVTTSDTLPNDLAIIPYIGATDDPFPFD